MRTEIKRRWRASHIHSTYCSMKPMRPNVFAFTIYNPLCCPLTKLFFKMSPMHQHCYLRSMQNEDFRNASYNFTPACLVVRLTLAVLRGPAQWKFSFSLPVKFHSLSVTARLNLLHVIFCSDIAVAY